MSRRSFWLLFVALVLASLAMVIAPAWLIQPFRPQTPGGVEVSHRLRALSPIATLVAGAAILALAVRLWRGARWFSRIPLVLGLALAGVAGWFARQNHFEWMFAPLEGPRFAPAAAASFVRDRDTVLAVTRGGESAAYPLRQLAYHHVVMDVVGGVPLVVTY